MTGNEALEMYTVYEHPKDYPHSYVVRRWTISKHLGKEPVADTVPYAIGPSLEAVRRFLPQGLSRIDREDNDDPVIVEVWL